MAKTALEIANQEIKRLQADRDAAVQRAETYRRAGDRLLRWVRWLVPEQRLALEDSDREFLNEIAEMLPLADSPVQAEEVARAERWKRWYWRTTRALNEEVARAERLREALKDVCVRVSQPDKLFCWCRDGEEYPEHSFWCRKARAAFYAEYPALADPVQAGEAPRRFDKLAACLKDHAPDCYIRKAIEPSAAELTHFCECPSKADPPRTAAEEGE
jgi:hypothetical protein